MSLSSCFCFELTWLREADLPFRKLLRKRESGTLWSTSLMIESVHETNFGDKRCKAAAANLWHALHVELNEVSLVVLQDGEAHTEDNL